MGTVRKRIQELIEQGPRTAIELSQLAGIKEKEVYKHLPHVEKTVKAKGKRLRTTPYQCRSCGFVFKDRKHFHPPSRCPLCKDERISEAVFEIG